MNKILLISLITLANLSYTSFPVNNISNEFYNKSEIVSGPAGGIAFVTLICLYLGSILWHLSKPIPKDVKKRKKFFRKLLLIIFIPIIIVGIIVIHSLQNMSLDISLDDIYENEPS